MSKSKSKGVMVKLPNGNWANPDHVTVINLANHGDGKHSTIVWAKMDSGYGTGRIFDEPGDHRDKIAGIINRL